MIQACNLGLEYINGLMVSMTADNPLTFIFGLGVIVAVFNLIMDLTSIPQTKK